MANNRLVWDAVGARKFETGVSHGVLFPMAGGEYSNGVVWNGLTAVNENPTGAEITPLYADDIKYLSLQASEEFGCGIECFTTPDEFDACDGKAELTPGVTIGQQERSRFGFSYQSKIGNDTEGMNHGYQIHLVYGCLASVSQKNRSTVNNNPEAMTLSYDVTSDPVVVEGKKPTAHLIIDSTKVSEAAMKAIEDYIYGSDTQVPTMPLPSKVVEIISAAA